MSLKIQPARLLISLACLSLTVPARAQSVTGTFTGLVTEQTGAVVPNATVTIINIATGAIIFTGQTDTDGAYRAPSIRAGVYRFAFAAAGFKALRGGQGRAAGQRQRARQRQMRRCYET